MIVWLYSRYGTPISIHWTHQDALKSFYPSVDQTIQPVLLSPLASYANQYAAFRGLKDPNADEAFKFLVSEIGELADAIVSQKPGWVRNDPDKERSISDEIGDVLLMLIKTAEKLGYDPISAMDRKAKSKGFYPDLPTPEAHNDRSPGDDR